MSLIAYIMMLLLFHKDNYIYTTGLSILNSEKGFARQLGIDVYRAIVAIVGCVMMFEGSTLITRKTRWVESISSKTMIIYIITASFFSYVPQLMSRVGVKVVFGSIPAALLDIVVLIPISIILIFISLLAERVVRKIKLEKVLLGK